MNTNFPELFALIHWSLIRHKTLLPVFTITQGILAFAIVYGLALLIPELTLTEALYLSSGATTLGIIAVGCVLSAQIINTSKQDGIITYQKTLPISRVNILLADFCIWGLASLPGIVMSFIAAYLRFDFTVSITIIGIITIIFSQIAMISVGFSIAYLFSSNSVALVTQLIMIVGLLFSPITYPAERLPEWLNIIYSYLPFVPISNLIRTTFFNIGTINTRDIFVIAFWTVLTFGLSLWTLNKRN
ncbi:MAG: ABC transporter permease [Culicoidibacterales bacterium]